MLVVRLVCQRGGDLLNVDCIQVEHPVSLEPESSGAGQVRQRSGRAQLAQLLHDFNAEYGEPTPPPHQLAARPAELIGGQHVTVLLAQEPETSAAVGVAVMRIQPSVWSSAQEAYLAELYVLPGHGDAGTAGS